MTSAPDPNQATQRQADPALGSFLGSGGLTGTERAAIGFGVIWAIAALVFFLVVDSHMSWAMTFISALIVIILPVMFVWLAVFVARQMRELQGENARLRVAIDALTASYKAQNKPVDPAKSQIHPGLIQRLDALAASQSRMDATLAQVVARPATQTDTTAQVQHPDVDMMDQPGLALGTPAEDLGGALVKRRFHPCAEFPRNGRRQAGLYRPAPRVEGPAGVAAGSGQSGHSDAA